MHILGLGGAGMVGRKFIERLAREGQLGGQAVTHCLGILKNGVALLACSSEVYAVSLL